MKTKRKYWTEEEKIKLIALYPTTLGKDLAKMFNCAISSIYYQAGSLNLKKDKQFIVEKARESILNPSHGARKHFFKKGTTPPNKGQKQIEYMSIESIEKSVATRFKKGNVPLNHRPVGSERITKDGYIEIKISEPRKWMLKHRFIWEQTNGKIPKNSNIQFKDGNRQNTKIDNLYLIARNEQMNQNSIVRYPPEIRTAIKRISKLNKLIRDE